MSKNINKWLGTINFERESMTENQVRELVDFPKHLLVTNGFLN